MEFPDLPGGYTCGNDDTEALAMAKEAMALHLYGMERDGDPIPEPTRIQDIKLELNQTAMLIEVWIGGKQSKRPPKDLPINSISMMIRDTST
ncbi:type II toxin-antitoxin system HicB family antitoxin [Effusibacillus consociatus]|uniref:Type II toxin-antitoxin system HicB family antitoxin n=1 Tax=Effusibacillus consociatus TaxID=1117041 RepID=A0ABV9Q6D1_9BACL